MLNSIHDNDMQGSCNQNKDVVASVAIGILYTALGFLLISTYYLIIQIHGWLKTAEWNITTLHKSLEIAGILGPNFYFDLPEALGVEKILNALLYSSASWVCFMTAIALLFFVFCIYIFRN